MSGDELQRLRASIDALDDRILASLNERAKLARAVGSLKVGQAYRPEREAQVLTRIKENNPGPLADETVALLFREIMSACLALERPITVAYLGPRGTFSEAATLKQFGLAADALATASIDEVFRSVESGAADFGVIPVENSTEGAVGRSLDLMPQSPMKVCGEVIVRIHHNLMAKAPLADPAQVKRVFSHGQSLGQCHEWLNTNLPRAGPRSSPGRRRSRARWRRSTTGSRSCTPTSRTSPTTPRASWCSAPTSRGPRDATRPRSSFPRATAPGRSTRCSRLSPKEESP